VKPWSLTTLREKLIKIGAKVVAHSRYVVFQTGLPAGRWLRWLCPSDCSGRFWSGFGGCVCL